MVKLWGPHPFYHYQIWISTHLNPNIPLIPPGVNIKHLSPTGEKTQFALDANECVQKI